MYHLRLASLLLLSICTFGCRSVNRDDFSEAMDAEQPRIWFASDGSAGECEPLAPACTGFQDEKTFVDLCVAKGHQAKTCGCSIRCSGKVDYTPPPSEVSAVSENGQVDPCSGSSRAEIQAIKAERATDSTLSSCIESHVCSGKRGNCEGTDLKKSLRMRRLANDGCGAEVVKNFCPDGYMDSFQCQEAQIEILSSTWAQFRNSEASTKRCFRSVICSDDESKCDKGDLRLGQRLRMAANTPGCNYWLLEFCKFGW